jgi:cytoskeletal protein CcmA (bactofilin family)
VRIDGKVTGNIETGKDNKVTVAIGPTGEVAGDITAHRVMVAGKVEGNIYAAERVEFHKDSIVQGDISYGSIAIEHGARLLGLVIQNPNQPVMQASATDAQNAIRKAQENRS